MVIGEVTHELIKLSKENPKMKQSEIIARMPQYHAQRVRMNISRGRSTKKLPQSFGWCYWNEEDQIDQTDQVEVEQEKIDTKESIPDRNYPTGLDGFKQLYDKSVNIPSKIKKGIDQYLKKTGWMYDDDFRRACGVKSTDWRRYAREFEQLQMRVDNGVLVWGHPDIIDQMREVALA